MATSQPAAPLMAQRTYQCLRLGAIGVILVLAVSLAREYFAAGDCLNRSISAYYYTSVQTVFVGTLIALGLVMIALWGKTAVEDGLFNLAGMLAPAVAFVPTGDKPYHCGVAASQAPGSADDQVAQAVRSSLPAVDNNLLAYLSVIGLVLAAMLVVGLMAPGQHWPLVTANPKAYWIPWVAAVVLWGFFTVMFATDRTWVYAHAHSVSATTLFVLILAAVFDIGVQKLRGIRDSGEESDLVWARCYFTLGVLMAVGAAAILLVVPHLPKEWADHKTFILEAWMIVLLAVFWGLQTVDRWGDGAPPVTDDEIERATAGAQPSGA